MSRKIILIVAWATALLLSFSVVHAQEGAELPGVAQVESRSVVEVQEYTVSVTVVEVSVSVKVASVVSDAPSLPPGCAWVTPFTRFMCEAVSSSEGPNPEVAWILARKNALDVVDVYGCSSVSAFSEVDRWTTDGKVTQVESLFYAEATATIQCDMQISSDAPSLPLGCAWDVFDLTFVCESQETGRGVDPGYAFDKARSNALEAVNSAYSCNSVSGFSKAAEWTADGHLSGGGSDWKAEATATIQCDKQISSDALSLPPGCAWDVFDSTFVCESQETGRGVDPGYAFDKARSNALEAVNSAYSCNSVSGFSKTAEWTRDGRLTGGGSAFKAEATATIQCEKPTAREECSPSPDVRSIHEDRIVRGSPDGCVEARYESQLQEITCSTGGQQSRQYYLVVSDWTWVSNDDSACYKD